MLALEASLLAAAVTEPSCSGRRPEPTTVAAIAEDPDAFIGRCVEVTGYSDGRSLFSSARAVRQHIAMKSMRRSGDRLSAQMIGVYRFSSSDALTTSHLWRLVGIVDSCERMQRRAQARADAAPHPADEFRVIMMTGHCHYLGGPTILVATAHLLKR